MRQAWLVTAYIRSEILSNTDDFLPMMSLDLIFFTKDAPTRQMISGLVGVHTRNCILITAEVTETLLPRDILP